LASRQPQIRVYQKARSNAGVLSMFHRRNLLATALVALVSPALAQTAWDMPTAYVDAVFHTQNIRQFADDVRAATAGGIDITVHSAGSLFAPTSPLFQ
jgi:TRAP-type C4-dicarboxylate transport system substrate-binding protein